MSGSSTSAVAPSSGALAAPPVVGVVVIGRNEGERFLRCLRSLSAWAASTVYVDSGSTDGSVGAARAAGVHVVALDSSAPFSAARGRNAGFARLVEVRPDVELVQFVDGDCEVVEGWIDRASAFLRAHPDVAVVCGRRRERRRDATVYNRLCDMEWARAPGRTDACGGDAMMRRGVFESVGGYDPAFVVGEDPELCHRIRAAGGAIHRLDAEMTLHDADLRRFGQWWRRTQRTGWAAAAGAARHGSATGGYNVRRLVRSVAWGIVAPVLAIAAAAAAFLHPAALWGVAVVALLYALVTLRSYASRRRAGDARPDAAIYAFFVTLGKPAEGIGVLQFCSERLRRRRARLVEYK